MTFLNTGERERFEEEERELGTEGKEGKTEAREKAREQT